MKQRVGRWWAFLLMGVGTSWVAAACEPNTQATDDNSETHFLVKCDGSCSGGLECICGVCTKPCSDDTGCGDLSADASCSDSCEAAPTTKMCDVPCSGDSECRSLGSEFSCQARRCRTQDSSPPGAGGSSATPTACQAKADPAPKLLANTELDPDVLARAAAVYGSCMGDDGIDRNVSYMWNANISYANSWHFNVTQARCLADANCGCAAISECVGFEISPVEPGQCQAGCSDGVVTFCGSADGELTENRKATLDCNQIGLSCSSPTSCVAAGAEACDESLPPKCDNGRPVECYRGAWHTGPDCASLELACEAGACVGTGAACVDQHVDNQVGYDGVSCAGGVLEACVGGKLASVDCAEQGPGFTCQTAMGKAFCGLASECLPARGGTGSTTNPPSCDGTVVTFCNAGRLEHFDCLDFGFTGCEVNKSQRMYGCTPSITLQ